MAPADTTISRSYRFYFMDSGGHIVKGMDIESSSDSEASELATLLLAKENHFYGIEVWERTRKVCKHTVDQ